MAIVINLDVMMAKRKMGLTELSKEVDVTMANLPILKNNKAKAIIKLMMFKNKQITKYQVEYSRNSHKKMIPINE